MSDKKQPEKSLQPAKPKKVLTEAEKAEKGREALARYMSWVMPLKGRHAFRGQADAEWGVTSGAYRRLEKDMKENPYAAQSLFIGYLYERINEARMRFSEYGGKPPLEVMAELQHYGTATGLIDFTESAQAALLFACKDEQDKPGKVFVVRLSDTKKIKEIKTREGITGELGEFFPTKILDILWAWRPGDGNSRMVTQQSLFLFGRPEIGEDFFAEVPFEVAVDEKIPLMEILESMGISESFMFPDIAGFAQANAHGKDYDLHRTKIYYDEKIGDPQTSIEKIKKRSFYFKRADLNQALKRYQEAREDYTCVINVAPQNMAAHNNRGIALCNSDRYDEALSDFTRAIEIDPQNATAHNNRGNAYCNLGRYEEGLADFERAIEIDPQYAEAHSNRGIVLAHLNRHEDAIVNYARAIEIDSQHIGAYNNRGIVLAHLNRCEEALSDFTRAIEIDSQNVATYSNRGSTYFKLGRYEEALADFNRAIEINPQYALAYNNRGGAYSKLKRQKEAVSDWKEAIRIGKQTGDKEIVQKATDALAKHANPK